MPISRWKALSEHAHQKIWDTMEDDNKTKILALSEQRKTAPNSTSSKFSVNAHDVTSMQGIPPDDKLEDILIAMVTKHSNRANKLSSHSGDVRSVLS